MTNKTTDCHLLQFSNRKNGFEQTQSSIVIGDSSRSHLVQAVQRRFLNSDLSEVSDTQAESILNTRIGYRIALFDLREQQYREQVSSTENKK